VPNIDVPKFNRVAVTACLVCIVAGAVPSAVINRPWPGAAGALVGIYLLFAIKVVQQWEKGIKLRLGRYVGLRGPGLSLWLRR